MRLQVHHTRSQSSLVFQISSASHENHRHEKLVVNPHLGYVASAGFCKHRNPNRNISPRLPEQIPRSFVRLQTVRVLQRLPESDFAL